MIKLATKSTKNLKLSKENKALLAKKLDSVSRKVAKRGVHVVIKHQGLYRIEEALSKSVVLDSIIYKRLAETLCVRLNRPSKHYPITSVGIERCQSDLNYYVKLYNDTVFYRYTIKTTQDDVKREVTFNRLHDTLGRMRNVALVLNSAL